METIYEAMKELPSTEARIGYLQNVVGWEFRQAVEVSLPQISDVCRELLRVDEERDIAFLWDCYQLPTIIDHFGADHVARSAFYRNLQVKGIGLISKSKLSGNNIMSCILRIMSLNERLRRRGLKYNFESNRTSELAEKSNRYNQMTLDEKIAFAGQIDALIIAFLSALSQSTVE